MNIRDVISSCKLSQPAPTEAENIDLLVAAIEDTDLPKIVAYLKKYPRYSDLKHVRVARAFFEHFTAQLGEMFFSELSFDVIKQHMDNECNIPSSFWLWFSQQKYNDAVRSTFRWSVEVLSSSHTVEHEKTYAHQFRHICLQNIPKAQTDFIDLALGYLNGPSVLQWREEDWKALQSVTVEKFSKHFVDEFDPERMLDVNYGVSLLALQTSFDNLPNFEHAFNSFFAQHQKDYDLICAQLNHPQGIKHSPGFKKLSQTIQKQFLNDLKVDFDDNEDGYGVLAGEYKHILGYTPDELFLKRFNESNENLMLQMNIVHKNAMFNLFSNQYALSSLHALVSHSPHLLLKMNKNIGDKIAQCLNDGKTLTQFFEVSASDFRKILKRFPILLDWRDEKGNSLGHWSAVFNAIEDEWFDVVVNNPQLLERNHMGHTVRDIIQHDIDNDRCDSTDELAQIDKIILTRELGAVEPKSSSRRKL